MSDTPTRRPLPPDVVAAILAFAGIRRGHVVFDLSPEAGLCAGAAAAAGAHGLVIAHQAEDLPLPLGAGCSVADVPRVLEIAPTAGARISRLMLTKPESEARDLEPLLRKAWPSLAPGARVTVACRPSAGDIADGLPAVLARCGLKVLHSERIETEFGPVATAVGIPVES